MYYTLFYILGTILDKYFAAQRVKISKNQKVEALANKAQALMYQYGEYQDREAVLEECGIVKPPTYVCMKGNERITIGGQRIDFSKLKGDMVLSTASLKELYRIEIFGDRVALLLRSPLTKQVIYHTIIVQKVIDFW